MYVLYRFDGEIGRVLCSTTKKKKERRRKNGTAKRATFNTERLFNYITLSLSTLFAIQLVWFLVYLSLLFPFRCDQKEESNGRTDGPTANNIHTIKYKAQVDGHTFIIIFVRFLIVLPHNVNKEKCEIKRAHSQCLKEFCAVLAKFNLYYILLIAVECPDDDSLMLWNVRETTENEKKYVPGCVRDKSRRDAKYYSCCFIFHQNRS